IIVGAMTNLSESNERLALRLGILALASKVERLLRLLLRFCRLAALQQQFCQAGMANGSRDIIIEFLLDLDGFAVLVLSGIQIVLALQRLAQALMRQADEALLIAHLINRQALHHIIVGDRKLADGFIVLPH